MTGDLLVAVSETSRKISVLIVTPYFQPAWGYGGPVRSVWNLARGLVYAGAEVEVVTTDADPLGKVEVPSIRKEEGVSIRTFPRLFRSIPNVKTYYFASGLSRYLEERIPAADIVHAQGLYVFPTYISSRKCGGHAKPFVISLRGSLGQWGLRQKAFKKQIYIHLVEKKSLGLSSSVHYTLHSEQDEAPDWAKSLPHTVVPNGIEFEPLSDGTSWRKKFEFPEGEYVIGMIGRIHPKKGILILLEAMARIVDNHPVRLAIVGDGEAHDVRKTQEDVQRLGLGKYVTFTGLLSHKDVTEAYAAIDLLALPSQEENFGNVVIEALAQNTPVAISPHVGLASWISEKNLGHVIPQNPEDWSEFLTALPEKRPDKARNLRTIAEDHFDYRKVGRRMLEAYRNIILTSHRS